MGVRTNAGGGASVGKLKTALQYADTALGIDVDTSSYGEICDALADFFPESDIRALVPKLSSNTGDNGFVLYSATYSDGLPWYVFDQNSSTRWWNYTPEACYIGYRFNSPVSIRRLELFGGYMGDSFPYRNVACTITAINEDMTEEQIWSGTITANDWRYGKSIDFAEKRCVGFKLNLPNSNVVSTSNLHFTFVYGMQVYGY